MFALAEKCWAFMQSRNYPQPWFSVMRLTSSMHETRRETADAVDRELGQHIIIGRLKYYKKFHEGSAPHPILIREGTSLHVCCAVDYISTTYKAGTYSSRCPKSVSRHTEEYILGMILAIPRISVRQQGQGYALGLSLALKTKDAFRANQSEADPCFQCKVKAPELKIKTTPGPNSPKHYQHPFKWRAFRGVLDEG